MPGRGALGLGVPGSDAPPLAQCEDPARAFFLLLFESKVRSFGRGVLLLQPRVTATVHEALSKGESDLRSLLRCAHSTASSSRPAAK
jgi:hypothetical protein